MSVPILYKTDFPRLGQRFEGKVRDVYFGQDKAFFITTDRQSAFDRLLAHIPFKGQVLTETAAWWFEKTAHIVQNHLLEVPDPNVLVVKKATIFPIEVIVRGYLTGVTSTSVWTAYQKGERLFCGNVLPEGMKKNEPFEKAILTPSTKSEDHDESVSAEELLERKLISKEQWSVVAQKAMELFDFGQKTAREHGLILVDTKYEFGLDENGEVMLCDEIHTPDSSRYWLADSYEQRMAEGKDPDMIDKEFFRLWFKANSDPYKQDEMPEAPAELVQELSERYIQLYERITGQSFIKAEANVEKRIEVNLQKYFQ